MSEEKRPGFATLAIHAGAHPEPANKARATPSYQTFFAFEDVEQAASGLAKRSGEIDAPPIVNSTQAVLEERIAALEGGTAALAVASGHAAQMIVFHTLCQPGDEIIAATRLYGRSINRLGEAYKKFGWNLVSADTDDLATVEAAVSPRTRAIFIESIGDPGGIVADIAALASVARRAGVPLIVDNTLATPYLCRPLEHGADIVVHSLTKFIGGHGNSMGGAIVDGGSFNWSREGRFPMLSEPRPEYYALKLHESFGNFAFAVACRVLGLRELGPAISPFNAFLILTGMETLPLRMQRHSDNALAVANWLSEHDEVTWVSYAGLPGDRYHNLAKRYVPKGAGAVLTFGVRGGYEAGVRLVESTDLCSHFANIGDTRTSIIHPASTTHDALPDEQRGAAGADVIRLSIGLEDVEDIIADLHRALQRAA